MGQDWGKIRPEWMRLVVIIVIIVIVVTDAVLAFGLRRLRIVLLGLQQTHLSMLVQITAHSCILQTRHTDPDSNQHNHQTGLTRSS